MADDIPFVDRLADINFVVDPDLDIFNASNAIYQGLYTEWQGRTQEPTAAGGFTPIGGTPNQTQANFQSQINLLMKRWDATNVNPSQRMLFPRTFDDFVKSYRAFFGLANTDPRTGAIYTGFRTEYTGSLQTTVSEGSDWSDLAGIEDVENEMVKSFDAFLENYPLKKEQPPGSGTFVYETQTLTTFMQKLNSYLTVTALIRTDSNTDANHINLSFYQRTFKAFFPLATNAEYQTYLRNFVNMVQADKESGGYFLPSHSFARFVEEVKKSYGISTNAAVAIGAHQEGALAIFWKLFALVSDMVEALQKAAAVTAQRLLFLTDYQKAYTELISAIPALRGPKPFDSADINAQLNDKANLFRENLRSFRSLVADDAKALQSNVNQLNEAVNQQTNLITALLQQASGLLSSIFR